MASQGDILKPSLLKEVLAKEGRVWLPVEGASMSPLFSSTQKIQVVPFSRKETCRGDLVVFFRDSSLACHRIVGAKSKSGQSYLLTKGDNNISWDLPLKAEKILGKVSAVEFKGKVFKLEGWSWRLSGRILAFLSWSAGYLWWQAHNHRLARWLGSRLLARLLRRSTLVLIGLVRRLIIGSVKS